MSGNGAEGCTYYKLKILELVKRMNLILGLTQENSIEDSLQDLFLFIYFSPDLCYDYTTPALISMLPSHILLLILHKATMLYICALMSYSLIFIVYVCTICIP